MAAKLHLLQDCAEVNRTDAYVLGELADNARITNAALAVRAGIPASTCLNRVRALTRAGPIVGYHTQISRRSLALNLDVLIGVLLKAKRAHAIHALLQDLKEFPHIVAMMRTSGAYDLMIEAHVRDTDHLIREVIDPLTENKHVGSTQTMLVHEHWRRMSLVGTFFRV